MKVPRFTTWVPQSIGGSMLAEAVPAEHFDRGEAERDALQALLNERDAEIDRLKSGRLSTEAVLKALYEMNMAYTPDFSRRLAAKLNAYLSNPRPIDERKEFERLFVMLHGAAYLKRDSEDLFRRIEPLGKYRWPEVQGSWAAWQARATLVPSA